MVQLFRFSAVLVDGLPMLQVNLAKAGIGLFQRLSVLIPGLSRGVVKKPRFLSFFKTLKTEKSKFQAFRFKNK